MERFKTSYTAESKEKNKFRQSSHFQAWTTTAYSTQSGQPVLGFLDTMSGFVQNPRLTSKSQKFLSPQLELTPLPCWSGSFFIMASYTKHKPYIGLTQVLHSKRACIGTKAQAVDFIGARGRTRTGTEQSSKGF